MISIRPSDKRGHFDHGWLDTRHTFSFGQYHDARHMGFRTLRVINEDRVAPGQGFGEHPHRDMEILTLVLSGELQHRDSMGHAATIPAGQMQAISAGTGITHSEFNASQDQPVHFYQIWITPRQRGLKPRYQQLALPDDPLPGLRLVAGPDPTPQSLLIHQDVLLHLVHVHPTISIDYPLARGRSAWLQVLEGDLTLNGHDLSTGDGASATDEPELTLFSNDNASALLFDLG